MNKYLLPDLVTDKTDEGVAPSNDNYKPVKRIPAGAVVEQCV